MSKRQDSALLPPSWTEEGRHALTLLNAVAEEEGHYVAEYEDGTNLAPAINRPLRGRRLA